MLTTQPPYEGSFYTDEYIPSYVARTMIWARAQETQISQGGAVFWDCICTTKAQKLAAIQATLSQQRWPQITQGGSPAAATSGQPLAGTTTPREQNATSEPAEANRTTRGRGLSADTLKLLGLVEKSANGLTQKMIVQRTGLEEPYVKRTISRQIKDGRLRQQGNRVFWSQGSTFAQPAQPGTTASNGAASPTGISVNDALIEIVRQNPTGVNIKQCLALLKDRYGLTPRANHVGVALSRHFRANRLAKTGVKGNALYYPPQPATETVAGTTEQEPVARTA